MTDLYLFRHGQTEWNTRKLYQGHRDSELTAQGINDILSMRNQIEGISFQTVYCSPLGRTKQTLALLSPETERTIFDPRLMEISLGSMEGQPFDQVPEGLEEASRNFWSDPENFRIPGAETFREVHRRVMDFIDEISRARGPVLAVTHTIPIRIILNWVYQKDFSRLWDEPAVSAGSLIRIKGSPPVISGIVSPAEVSASVIPEQAR